MRITRENNQPITWFAAAALLLATALPVTATADSNSDQWEYEALIYGWFAGIKGTAQTGADVDVSFDDILDNLEMTIMGSFGARKGKWSLLADAMYMNIVQSDGGSETIPTMDGDAEVTRRVDVDVDMKSWITNFGAGYNLVNNEKTALDLVGGVRYVWMDLDLKLDLAHEGEMLQTSRQVKVSDSDSILDGVIGLKGQYNINDKWFIPYYADIGAGESDLTWQAMTGVGYRFKWCDVLLTYRHLDYEFDSDFLMKDLTVSGVAMGAKFSF